MAVDTTKIIVSGAGSTEVNGEYVKADNGRYYLNANPTGFMLFYDGTNWFLSDYAVAFNVYYNSDSGGNPANGTWLADTGTAPVPTVAYAEISDPVIPLTDAIMITPTNISPSIGDIGVLVTQGGGCFFLPSMLYTAQIARNTVYSTDISANTSRMDFTLTNYVTISDNSALTFEISAQTHNYSSPSATLSGSILTIGFAAGGGQSSIQGTVTIKVHSIAGTAADFYFKITYYLYLYTQG